MKRSMVLMAALCGLVAFAMALSVTALLHPGAASAQDRLVAAEGISIVDSSGVTRMVLHSGPDIGAGVDVLATDGTPRLVVQTGGTRGTSPDSASVNIHRSDGSRVIRLGIEQEQLGGRLIFEDDQGKARLAIAVDRDGTPSMTMWDANGNVTWSAP